MLGIDQARDDATALLRPAVPSLQAQDEEADATLNEAAGHHVAMQAVSVDVANFTSLSQAAGHHVAMQELPPGASWAEAAGAHVAMQAVSHDGTNGFGYLPDMPEEQSPAQGVEHEPSVSTHTLDIAMSSEGGEEEVVRTRRARHLPALHCSRQALLRGFLLSLLLGSAFATVYIYLYSWYVLLFHGLREQCDVPLAPWLLVYLLLAPLYLLSSCWQPWVNRVLCNWSPESSDQPPPLRVKLLAWMFTFGGYYVLFFEMDLVKQAKTCKQTAPALYTWASYLAPTGVIHFFVLGLLVSCSFTALVMITRAAMDAPRPADPNVIRQLETVCLQQSESERQCSICVALTCSILAR
jgi:hypothetical protein